MPACVSVRLGAGRGVGSLVTGQLFRALGARWTFRAYGVAAALMLPVSLLIDSRWPLHYDRRGVEVKTEKHVGRWSCLFRLVLTVTEAVLLGKCLSGVKYRHPHLLKTCFVRY